jgi:hypothetical protein
MPENDKPRIEVVPTAAGIEAYYTVGEIAAKWKLGFNTVKRLFADEPGVLKIGEQRSRLVGRGKYKRRYVTLRIPESAFLRVQKRLVEKRPAHGAGGGFVTDGRPDSGLHAG